ncbi:hypothetical protein ACOSQ2_009055 [Xanthoceras sorbifolium]
MIPINILSKMGIYELKLNPRLKVVKAIVIDSAALIDSNITELRSLLQKPVVGFDVKFDTDHDDQNKKRIAKLLLLYVDCRCLIIQLHSLASIPDGLKQFLADEAICFVGTGIENKVTSLQRYGLSCVTAVEVGDFAARVLKKPNISSFGITDLATEVGLPLVRVPGLPERTPDWSASVFTEAEVKYAILEARGGYLIGSMLLGKLNL